MSDSKDYVEHDSGHIVINKNTSPEDPTYRIDYNPPNREQLTRNFDYPIIIRDTDGNVSKIEFYLDSENEPVMKVSLGEEDRDEWHDEVIEVFERIQRNHSTFQGDAL